MSLTKVQIQSQRVNERSKRSAPTRAPHSSRLSSVPTEASFRRHSLLASCGPFGMYMLDNIGKVLVMMKERGEDMSGAIAKVEQLNAGQSALKGEVDDLLRMRGEEEADTEDGEDDFQDQTSSYSSD